MMHLRQPIVLPFGKPLGVLIHARFSTEEQRQSSIDDQIADGDFVVVRRQKKADRGQIVVALTDENEATLKRWYPEKNRIRLEPANSDMKPIYVKSARVLGVVVGVVRKVA